MTIPDEFFLSDQFRQFQQELVKLMVRELRFTINTPDPERTIETTGALKIIGSILNLPGALLQDKEKYGQEIDIMTDTAFIDLRIELIREAKKRAGVSAVYDANSEVVLDSNGEPVREG